MHKLATTLAALGPLGVFALALLDSIGVPLPAAIDILLLTISVETPQNAYGAALGATVGSMIGNLGLFTLARGGGRRWVKPPEPGKQQRFRAWFHRYGLVTVFVPAVVPFVPLPLKAFVVSAGVFHTPIARFAMVIAAARVLRYFGQAWLGIHLGTHADDYLKAHAWTITGITLGIALIVVWILKWKAARDQEAAGGAA
jgi:membrane protein DedA with SNARE-associated domain